MNHIHNNNNNNNNNNNKIKDKKEKKNNRNGERASGGKRASERDFLIFISLFTSFSDLWKSDRRFSSGLKAKLIYLTRAMRGHQNLGVSSNSTR